jgi:hypothetical protein
MCKNKANNITDRLLLKAIYDEYYSVFCTSEIGVENRASRSYVIIDHLVISNKLNLDPDIVFGRLFYHLDKKYGYKDENIKAPLFALKGNEDKFAVNFPLLSAVVAELEQSHIRFTLPLWLSILAIIISAIALFSQVSCHPKQQNSSIKSSSISQMISFV